MRDLVLACEALYLVLHGPESCGVWVTLERVAATLNDHGERCNATPGEPSVWRATIGEAPDTTVDHTGLGDDPTAAARSLLGAMLGVAQARREVLSDAIGSASAEVARG